MRKIGFFSAGVDPGRNALDWLGGRTRVEIKEVPESHVVWVRAQTPIQQMGPTMGRVFGEIFRYLGPKGIQPTGPPVAVYYSPPDSTTIDLEVCVPVPADVTGDENVKVKTLPGGRMASLIYVGPYRNIGPSYSALTQWIEKNGYRQTGPPPASLSQGTGVNIRPERVPDGDTQADIK